MTEKLSNSLLKQKSAIGSYLDEMLHQATEVSLESETESETEAVIDEVLLPVELLTETKLVESQNIATDNVPANSETELVIQGSELTSDMFPLQCLMFKVGKILMSIPLVEMNSIVEWHGKLTRLPNEPDWVLGILKHRGNNVRVVDSSKVLQIKRNSEQEPTHVLLFDNEKWGLTCDSVDKVVTINYDDVQWARNKPGGMTLGTVRSSLSSLLNIRGIIERLQS